MAKYYSRLTRTEEKKNRRSVIVFGALTVLLIIFIFTYGFSLTAKVSNLLASATGRSPIFEVTDDTPPAPPQIDSLPEQTNDPRLIVKGSAEPESKVIITLNGTEKEILTDIDGDFSSSFTLTRDKNSLSAVTVDEGGNTSKPTQTYNISYDITKPEINITNPKNGQSFFGKDKQITIEGETELETSVTINERVIVVGGGGKFSHPYTLSDGENTLNFLVVDLAGNESEVAISVSYSP
ncbi:MAG: hypothetical protein UV74_C0013G0253 [Candidatus Woesebacteria bacterium GW2011_GWB1_43_14]|uniref:Bacterial Ig domain-containing protein n=1 Tax=Candidatus Woesebacteria bacterium GW2011_GWB1_43_14 TaxID=1618578 RepID=A0A0G1FQ35_9BACT|nr:MAG: hypothetical protein UT21_C0002G0040 [Candidatus Woesebacteria bacterium GW2011_GWA1_39_11b]KKS78453.1 MAG: hypothetical protein UV51_C0001G0169 [Candidatus Woesebacteria bacterium GW2011_GWC1_42_9]KKS97131.1 MAG: hypothetical protein UV74_C0013G0253 [Candidatus Woesebacteria bacterium GW2011_GWB1_43_14]